MTGGGGAGGKAGPLGPRPAAGAEHLECNTVYDRQAGRAAAGALVEGARLR